MSGEIFSYRYLKCDRDLDNVAQRFGTTRDEIFRLTRQRSAGSVAAIDSARNFNPPPGTYIVVESKQDESLPSSLEWVKWNFGVGREFPTIGRLLHALTTRRDLPRRLGLPSNRHTAELVWFYYRNALFREETLVKQNKAQLFEDGSAVELSDPASAELEEGQAIWLPLKKQEFTFVPISPQEREAQAFAVEVGTSEFELLRRRFRSIRLTCDKLASIRRESRQILADCDAQIHHMDTLVGLTNIQVERFGEGGGRKAVHDAFVSLNREAHTQMLDSPHVVVSPDIKQRWDATAADLGIQLTDTETRTLLDRVLPKYASRPTYGFSHMIGDQVAPPPLFVVLYETAVMGIFWFSEADKTGKSAELLEATLDAIIGSVPGKQPDVNSTESLIDYAVRFVPAAAAVSATMFGQLPGPDSVCVAAVKLFVAWHIPKGTTDATALKKSLDKAYAATGSLLGLRGHEARDLPKKLRSANKGTRENWYKKLDKAGKGLQGSPAWFRALGLLNVLGLAATIADRPDKNEEATFLDWVKYGANVGSSSAGSVGAILAAADTLKKFSLATRFLQSDAAIVFLGRASLVFGAIAGGISAYLAFKKGNSSGTCSGGLTELLEGERFVRRGPARSHPRTRRSQRGAGRGAGEGAGRA